VLAVAALAPAGCGGGSSDSSSSGTSDAPDSSSSGLSSGSSADPAGSAAQDGSNAEAEAEAGTGSGAASAEGATAGGASAGSGGEVPSSSAKRGPSVPQPTGAPEPGITPEQRRQATVASMSLESPSSRSSSAGPQALPAEYGCDGKNTSPALRWQGVPQGTAELVLFAMNVQPVNEKLFFDWAVAGLDPELEEIEAGKLPKGAVLGRNSFGKTGYGICPEGGETYMFAVFALPKKLSPSQGFDPLAVRKAATEASGNVGLLALGYTRG
jgi:phosphatidylethanolamine-binding protein (PEBP) family uncharacterized protein